MENSSNQDSSQYAVTEREISAFPFYTRLPLELRRKIWTYFLGDVTPQIYAFKLRYPERMSYNPRKNHLMPGDQIFLQPLHVSQHLKGQGATRHIASATCVESRQIMLELSPDTLKFRDLPYEWMCYPSRTADSPDAAGFPEYVLRYNGMKDIIVFHAVWEDQEAAVKISDLMGSCLDDFLKMRHVGIADAAFNTTHDATLTSTERYDCACTTAVCLDHCQREPLPRFLSLFPLLKTFYIVQEPVGPIHSPGSQTRSGYRSTICPCPADAGSKHKWPTIKSQGLDCWNVIYDERWPCPFPKCYIITKIRRRWRSNFPYYRPLNHLDIKFIRPWMCRLDQTNEEVGI